MPSALTVLYLVYIFISLYMLALYIMIYIPNRREFFSSPKPEKEYSLDMIVPCYNEEDTIEGTIKALLDSDYQGLKKIIVVDDNSTDNSFEITKKIARENSRVIAVQTPKNTGKASGSKNYGAKFSKSEIIGFSDADSYPDKTAIGRMIGFFNDEKVGAVTSAVLAKKPEKLLERLQSIEYRIIVFTRKLLDFVGAIYVTPGPLALYRKSAFEKVGGFNEKNMTEDIEITWHLVSEGYRVRMSSLSRVYTVVPDRLKPWFRQRLRWNIGGVQTINHYKKAFGKKGILGGFILPFFILSWIIGVSGLAILFYRLVRTVVVRVLSTTYSIQAQAAIITFRDINLVPDILFFFGVVLIVFGTAFTLVALKYTKDTGKDFKKVGIFSLLGYSFLYLLAYPILLLISVYKLIFRRSYSW